MERMGDGRQDTWAEWKTAVLALPDDAMFRYLHEAEGYDRDRVAAFLAHESAILPGDWTTSDAAREAVTRFFAYKSDVLDSGHLADALDRQAQRAAATPPPGRAGAGACTEDDDESPPDGRPFETNASNYGGSSLDEAPLEDRVLHEES